MCSIHGGILFVTTLGLFLVTLCAHISDKAIYKAHPHTQTDVYIVKHNIKPSFLRVVQHFANHALKRL